MGGIDDLEILRHMGVDLSHIPLGPPPPGLKSNFVNPKNQKGVAEAVMCIFMVIMILFVTVRMYTKLRISRAPGWDDWTCLMAALFSIISVALTINVLERGYGVHVWNSALSMYTKDLARTLNAIAVLYGPTVFFTKLSLLILYYRLFSPSAIMRYLIYVGVTWNSTFYTLYFFLYIFLCPTTSSRALQCQAQLKIFSVAACAINVASDFYTLLIPLSAVSRLQLAPRKRLGLMAIFFTGLLACLASIVSLHYRVVLNRSHDDTWNSVPVMVIASVEFNVGIICSCLPTLPVLFRKPGKASEPSYIANASSGAARSSDQGYNSKRGFAHIEYQPRQDSISKLEEGRPSMARGGGSEKAFKLMGLDKDPERTNDWFRRARA